jgi:hypothetical protein
MIDSATRKLNNSQARNKLGCKSPLSKVWTAMLLCISLLVVYEDSILVKLV